GEDISVPYDRFRGRLIFPIADLRGQPIAFGGRILDQSHPAKYLNSPETPLFQKGRVLYNAHIARKAAHDSGAVIVGEGYMDVIALWEAGHHHAVAPLGTALTPGQLELLWRMADEPTLCLDGDTAGRKAAERAADTALELLEPGRSLQFSFLPDGLDPDDLLRSQGPQAVTALLGHTMPLADLLWEKAWQRRDKSTPERRAAARGTLLDACETIKHPVVRAEYVRTMKDRIWNDGRERGGSTGGSSLARTTQPAGRQFAPGGGQHHRTKRQNGPRTGTPPPAPHTPELLGSSVIGSGPSELDMLERQLMQFLAAHFQLMDDLLDTVADLELADSEANALRSRLLNEQSASVGVDIYLRAHDLEDGQDQGSPTSTCAPTEATPAQPLNGATPPADITEQIWRQLFSQYTAATLRRDIQQALGDFEASSDPSLLDEIARLQLALAAVTNEMHAADGTDVT
ncbi:MAG: toprim domain-containing protein, partial [Pseudomonadota bacterium]